MRQIAGVLVMFAVMGMSGQVRAEEYGTDGRDIAAGTALLGGWAAAVSVLPGSVVAEYGAIAPVLFGMVAGPIREWQTAPEKRGLFRYNGQALAENAKWEPDPETGGRWKRLKGYVGQENVLLTEKAAGEATLIAQDGKKWKRTSPTGFMTRK